jgi:hypothetical protein
MLTRLATLTLAVAFIAGCGGGNAGATSKPNPPATGSQPAGQVDCAAIKTAAQQLLAIQLLAQLKTPDAIASIKAKQIGNLDLDAFLAAMKTLHALDSHASPLGDPKAAIDFYETAGKAALVLFATSPMTQAAIDTYNKNVGSVSDFLSHQAAISGAIGAAGC